MFDLEPSKGVFKGTAREWVGSSELHLLNRKPEFEQLYRDLARRWSDMQGVNHCNTHSSNAGGQGSAIRVSQTGARETRWPNELPVSGQYTCICQPTHSSRAVVCKLHGRQQCSMFSEVWVHQ